MVWTLSLTNDTKFSNCDTQLRIFPYLFYQYNTIVFLQLQVMLAVNMVKRPISHFKPPRPTTGKAETHMDAIEYKCFLSPNLHTFT